MPFSFQSIYLDPQMVEGRILDLFVPESVSGDAAILFIHGGGWRSGSRSIYHPIMGELVRRGCICASTDYRLKGVTALDQLTDVRHACDLLHAKLRERGLPERVFVVGSSAGGHLALLLTLATPGACGEGLAFEGYRLDPAGWRPPIGAAVQAAPVRFTPWEDIFPAIWQSMQEIAGARFESDPQHYERLSPIHHVHGGGPPIFLLEAENEHMFPLEEAEAFADRVRQVGGRAELRVYPKVEHGFFYALSRRQQRQAFEDILAFMASID